MLRIKVTQVVYRRIWKRYVTNINVYCLYARVDVVVQRTGALSAEIGLLNER
jgi:hypothetical protein